MGCTGAHLLPFHFIGHAFIAAAAAAAGSGFLFMARQQVGAR